MRNKIIMIAAACCVLLSGCRVKSTKEEAYPEVNMMTVVDGTTGYTIYVHDETGVMYLCCRGAYAKAVCVMLDAEGNPLIYK